jgi:NTE family protein
MKQIRVALSGSGFRLGAHLGALQAIHDAGYEVVELAGTSGGSIVAALHASGMTLDGLHQLCMSMNWSSYMTFSPWTLLTKQALCSGNALLDFLTKQTAGKRFSDLAIDLKIIASDLVTESEFQFSKANSPDAPIALAARASASIPIVFVPVEYGAGVYQDGGMCDNIPVSDLTVDEVPRVGIYLQSNDPPLLPAKRSIVDLAPRMIDLLLASNEASHVALDTRNGAVIVPVETAYASSFDRNMSAATRARLYADGYAATAAALAKMATPTVAA